MIKILYKQITSPLKSYLKDLSRVLFDSPLLIDEMTLRIGEQQNQRLLPMH